MIGGAAFNLRAWIHRSGVASRRRSAADARALAEWLRAGRPVPPPHAAKQQVVRETAERLGRRILIESGTFLGDMVAAMQARPARAGAPDDAPPTGTSGGIHAFDAIHTIELAPHLAAAAKRHFRGDARVVVHQGDSALLLPEILRTIHEPVVFWLDGHWSAGVTARGDRDTPILAELAAIFAHRCAREHAILVDDARLFDGSRDYPTIAEIERRCAAAGVEAVTVVDDVIRIGAAASAVRDRR
ncbi:MAG: hypothetical protein U0575_12535 [Phycisphaerales bacterium]